VTISLIGAVGWQDTLVTFGVVMLLILPLSLALASGGNTQGSPGAAQQQSLKEALSEAFAQRSYLLLVLGFFTCGFQLAFITVHMPPYLVDRGLSADVGGWTIGVIGLFNIIGSLMSGWLSNYMPKRYILSVIYFGRALAILAFIMFPVTPLSAILFGAAMGFLWLSTVAPTNGIIALMFGTRWLATLAGFAFFSHQVGGFLGVWLGGVVFERTGSYDTVWWLAILFGVLSAVINLPIVEKPVVRAAVATA
jgi:predicted MFS family arabinose efflux permease